MKLYAKNYKHIMLPLTIIQKLNSRLIFGPFWPKKPQNRNFVKEVCQVLLLYVKKSMHRFVIMPTQLILTNFLSRNPDTRLFAKKIIQVHYNHFKISEKSHSEPSHRGLFWALFGSKNFNIKFFSKYQF